MIGCRGYINLQCGHPFGVATGNSVGSLRHWNIWRGLRLIVGTLWTRRRSCPSHVTSPVIFIAECGSPNGSFFYTLVLSLKHLSPSRLGAIYPGNQTSFGKAGSLCISAGRRLGFVIVFIHPKLYLLYLSFLPAVALLCFVNAVMLLSVLSSLLCRYYLLIYTLSDQETMFR